MDRRSFLRATLGASTCALTSSPLYRALAAPGVANDEFFLFIHAQGAWDVTVGLDPRNERRGIIEPASTVTIDPAPLRHFRRLAIPLDGVNASSGYSFELVRPSDAQSPLVFGPGIGNLLSYSSRLTVVNGIAMNTVSHQDGTLFAATGRHPSGGRAIASSIDTMMADFSGTGQLLPAVSVSFPSSFVGATLDRRVVPLSISSLGTISASLRRSTAYESAAQRDAVTALLSKEAEELATESALPEVMTGMSMQYASLRRMNQENLLDVFTDAYLRGRYPSFNYAGMGASVNAAFALEAMRRNVVRCVSFSYGSFDTHTTNYRQQPLLQQNLFDMLATVLSYLDQTPHPTRTSDKLADHTHILVFSDFCRTPMINQSQGRDHYPNNSSLIISPRFRQNFVFGKSDPEQLLSLPSKTFRDGSRPIGPPDVLATFVSAFGGTPRKYLRDGEVVSELLR